MNEAQYALVGVAVGAIIPALALIVQSFQAGRQAAAGRAAAKEQRRDAHRLALITAWRVGLAAVLTEIGRDDMAGHENPLYNQPWYLSLRPHLTDEARERAEPSSRTLVTSGGAAPVMFHLNNEIARIEREWGLT